MAAAASHTTIYGRKLKAHASQMHAGSARMKMRGNLRACPHIGDRPF